MQADLSIIVCTWIEVRMAGGHFSHDAFEKFFRVCG